MKPELIELFKATASEGDVGETHRQAFASALKLPIGSNIEAEATVRQIFWVDKLEPGAPASYPKDGDEINAYVMPGRGAVPQNIVGGDELFVQTFEIASSAEWKFQYARNGRYNVAERELEKMKDAIVREENKNGWAVIRSALLAENTVDTGATSLDKNLVNMTIAELDGKEGYKTDLVVIHPKRVADFRNWSGNEVDDSTYKKIHTRNSLGNIWGVDIMLDFNIDENEIFAFDTTRLGVMPVRQELTVIDDPSAVRFLRTRYVGYEEVGFAVSDQNAVVRGVIN